MSIGKGSGDILWKEEKGTQDKSSPLTSFPTNEVIKSIKPMGTCTIRDKNFLYREAMEAICLLQCRWESVADVPDQLWPFQEGRGPFLPLLDFFSENC